MTIEFSSVQQGLFETNLAALDADIARTAGKPEQNNFIYNKSLMLLASGKFADGWKMFESRFKTPGFKFSPEHFPLPTWNGEDLAGKDVFVWFEQGIGDQIMCASMLDELIAVVGDGSITLLADRVMVETFRRSFPSIDIYKVGEEPSERLEMWDFDFQLCFSDLGQMFRKKFDDFPGKSFLKPDPARVEHFRRKYADGDKKLIGIAWSSASGKIGADKSFRLYALRYILKRDDCVFVNMQYGDHFEELMAARNAGINIICDPEVDQLIEMDDFCAQVAAMDYVISNSNTLVHVAGALGVDTRVLLPLGRGRLWYWFSEASHTPWYKSMTLYRQSVVGEWDKPIGDLHVQLDSKIREERKCQLLA